MNSLFWGLVLILVDVSLTLGTATFELLPDFLGFFLIMKGMTQLAGENKYFDKGRHLAFSLSIVYLIVWVSDLLELDTGAKVGMWVFCLAALIVQLTLLKKIVAGIRQMELDEKRDLHGERVQAMWLILVVLSMLRHLLSWLPIVGAVCGIAELLVGILFLAAFRECAKQYKAE